MYDNEELEQRIAEVFAKRLPRAISPVVPECILGLGDLAAPKSNLTAEDFLNECQVYFPHRVAEPRQCLNGDSRSIRTDYMIGSRRHQNFINQLQLHLPGSCASPAISSALS